MAKGHELTDHQQERIGVGGVSRPMPRVELNLKATAPVRPLSNRLLSVRGSDSCRRTVPGDCSCAADR